MNISNFDEYGLKYKSDRNNTEPEILARIGCSLGNFYGYTSGVIIGFDGDNQSIASAYALASGLMYSGASVKFLYDTTLPVMRWLCRQGIADGGVYISSENNGELCILNSYGNDLSSAERKQFVNIFRNNVFTDMPDKYVGNIEKMQNPEEFYTAHISELFPEAYKCLCLDMRNVKNEIKNIVSAVIISELFPDAPIFVPLNSFLSVSQVLSRNKNLIRCGCNTGDTMYEMEKFMKIPGVYQQYLMMYDDFAFELAVSHYKAIKGLTEIRQIRIPNTKKKELFIACDKHENDYYDRLCDNKFIKNNFEIGDYLLHFRGDGYVRVVKDSAKHGFNIYTESLSDEYADDIITEINNIILSYK